MVYRCVGQALAQSFDPRGSLKEFNWDALTDGLLTPDDLKMVWFFIEREVRFYQNNVILINIDLHTYPNLLVFNYNSGLS